MPLTLFRTVSYFEQFRECSEGTHFLTHQIITNIKLLVIFRRESSVSISYHFSEIDKIKCLYRLALGILRGRKRIPLMGNGDEPIFRGLIRSSRSA